MAFASFDNKRGNAPLAEINMVPLIDVMLVLLVIFIVAAPLLTHSVKLELPKASATVTTSKADQIRFAIDADGVRYWNDQAVSREEAAARFVTESSKQPQPEIQLSADNAVPYGAVAETLADAATAGLSKIGFVTNPESVKPGVKLPVKPAAKP
jgi:biopolymer transport protein ExbD